MAKYATVNDVIALFRALTPEEQQRVTSLLPIVEDELRQRAHDVGKDLDNMIDNGDVLPNVVKSVVVDVVARTLMTPTNEAPMSQYSESALGYTVSGTFLVPGGGLFVKKSELERLGLRRQRIGVIELYGEDKGYHC